MSVADIKKDENWPEITYRVVVFDYIKETNQYAVGTLTVRESELNSIGYVVTGYTDPIAAQDICAGEYGYGIKMTKELFDQLYTPLTVFDEETINLKGTAVGYRLKDAFKQYITDWKYND